MRGIRVAQGILISVSVVVGGLIGIATNAASAKPQPWPGPLRWVQAEPWRAALGLAAIAIVVAIALEVLNWRAGRHDAAARPPGPVTAADPAEQVWNIPAPVRSFTGRTRDLAHLHTQLAATDQAARVPAAALYGMGGIGKTQLARAYAHAHRDRYRLGWWIPAETPDAATTALADLAVHLGADPTRPQPELAADAVHRLASRDDWLLVFDNATSPAEVEPLLPAAGGGQVLLTSRSPAWHGIATPIPVDLLPLADAVRLLQARTADSDGAAAERLAEALGRLPLAVEQAAAYAADQQLTLAGYLKLFEGQRAQLLAAGRPLAYDGTVDATVMLTVDQLAKGNPAAVQLLSVLAVLDPDELPIDLLLGHPEVLGEPLATAADDPAGRAELRGLLLRSGLLTADPAGSVRIHRLTQAVVLANLPDSYRHALITSVRPTSMEIEFMAHLGPLLPTPRAAKQLVNLYRLVRIGIGTRDQHGLEALLDDTTYQVVQILLAILVGAPTASHAILTGIIHATGSNLVELLGGDHAAGVPDSDWAAAATARRRVIDTLDGLRAGGLGPVNTTLAVYQQWCPPLARYSVHTRALAAPNH
jgi:hypothetical protein